ncbi:iron-siderophore ABC transporter substrate-binding protein [Ascidiaceihabitans sp.]|uniref:iron-siderophore ABC transporter substrate-binding protein n=1 Tax=Ascidiaceihabitans sp. TaxID=1872644 RepID=UPI00329A5104
MSRFALTVSLFVMSVTTTWADGFPQHFTHRYGTTIVVDEPQKVVSISYIGHDFLLALGVKPYALRKWYGTDAFGVWPWGHEALGDATPIVLQGQLDFEQIAALRPDLIIGQWSGISEQDYKILSRIAPTIAPQVGFGDYGMRWQDMLATLGRATDTTAKAQAIINRIETRFTTLKAQHPEWQDASAVMVFPGQTGAYTARDIRGRFLEDLGFKVPAAINEHPMADNFYVPIPDEDLSAIDTDALIWLDAGGSIPTLQKMPLRPHMTAFKEGREVYASPMLSAALSHSSPLSLDYALDALVPLLEAATDGNPHTVVPSMQKAGIAPAFDG